MNINISASRFGLEMLFDVVDGFLPLLANIDDRTVGFHVLVDFDRDGLRDAQACGSSDQTS